MRLHSIFANVYLAESDRSITPLRFRLDLEGGEKLRLRGTGNGTQMIVDRGPLDDPFVIEGCGKVDLVDVTPSHFPELSDAEVMEISALVLHGHQVGVKLILAPDEAFHFWVNDDELYWGSETMLAHHPWLNSEVPAPAELIIA